uniref:Uncharacterized protein n=1 Tax=Gallus gallus TaxID=9031 RepID=A0A8V0Z175_CHICK
MFQYSSPYIHTWRSPGTKALSHWDKSWELHAVTCSHKDRSSHSNQNNLSNWDRGFYVP